MAQSPHLRLVASSQELQLCGDRSVAVSQSRVRFHGNYEGGLLEHSMKVYEIFKEKIATQGDSYNREGGSGLPKITKIMKSDLHVTDSKFSMYAKGSSCFTNISLSIKDLKVDAEKI